MYINLKKIIYKSVRVYIRVCLACYTALYLRTYVGGMLCCT